MISIVDKTKIIKYLNSYAINDIYYDELLKIILKNKYTEQELLIYFIEYVEDSFKKDSFSVKLVLKFLNSISIFIRNMDLEKLNNKDKNLCVLRNFKILYQEFLLRTNTEEENEVSIIIDEIESYVNENYPNMDNNSNQDLLVDEEEIRELKSQIASKEKVIETLELKADLDAKKLEKNKEKITLLEKNIKSKRTRIKELEAELAELLVKITELENRIVLKDEELASNFDVQEQQKDEYDELLKTKENQINRLKASYEELQQSFEELKKELQLCQKQLANIEVCNREQLDSEIKQSKIENLILEYICNRNCTMNNLENMLRAYKRDITREEIYKILFKIKQVLNLDSSRIGIDGPIYSLQRPVIKKNTTFNMEVDTDKYLDIVFTADYHIDILRTNFLENYDKLLDYCILNNIKLIVNAGDFFDFGTNGYDRSLKRLNEMQEIVEKCSRELPIAPGVYQAVLGGNHDEWNMYMGKDFLTYFIDSREDFLSLGFQNAIISLTDKTTTVSDLVVSHPNELLSRKEMDLKISKICSLLSIAKKNCTFSFLGHSHESYLDIENKVCVLPSFTIDRFMNGACHVRFHFDSNKISQIDFKPLVLERKLIPVSEIIYKK